MPPERAIEFKIELQPGTTPIAPYNVIEPPQEGGLSPRST
jgi:hypothetical protein